MSQIAGGQKMTPKKKEDAKVTCNVGTDPPEPLDFDPFDVDDYGIVRDWKEIPELAYEALEMLKSQNTTGALKVIKDNIIKKLEQLIQWMESFTKSLSKARSVAHRLQCIERDIREIKTTTKDIQAPVNTWAQIAAKNSTTDTIVSNDKVTTLAIADARAKRREIQEKQRKVREPYEITLTTTNSETKEILISMHARKITEQCQSIIDKDVTTKLKINGINKITNGIRVQCKSPEDATLLRETVDWNTAFKDSQYTSLNMASLFTKCPQNQSHYKV